MSSLKLLLPLLAASAPLCNSFAPVLIPSVSRASIVGTRQPHVLRAAPGDNDKTGDANLSNNDALERIGKVAGSALFALTLSFSAMTAPVPFSGTISSVPSANAIPSITIASKNVRSDDDIKWLELETREAEKEVKADRKKARVERSREAFFEYDAKMAEEQEARIEAAEQKAEVEAEKDQKEAERLKALEQRVEKEANVAVSKEEKLAKQKIAKALLKKEKELERKEKKAERAEKVFLAEEQQEKKILQQKEDAAIAEEKKYEAVEKEYEMETELAQDEELELRLLKGFSSKKK
mmetsp:Transcript_59/g.127  ORF Transcript_59/g.127 Transcript_59/m.127 type:complete len:295 (-) Transcript_59:224-1108(-)|eukprot:CAMPEP_0172318790 /NCGR_PEP_ID=MMETSP1058-20130122/35777_1 /TAXON_ID=83371 /ORGANISM="Detonula confervacea, Strain CCMP 353" /LENGTH=294 /DNA_ID=CAMNT_0013033691 /DNA_START=76 /DNA_END=960 /DNA_ORIENTATION=-